MISGDDYRFLCELLSRTSGLDLGPGKAYLVENRLPAVLKAFGLADISALVLRLRGRRDLALEKAVADAMTTGETLFFRDMAPFTSFRQTLLPEAVERARSERRAIRVWSAAASSGQEVYSIAMIIDEETRRLAGTAVELLATDYCAAAINRAAHGVYSQLEVQRGLPIKYLLAYFTKTDRGFVVRADLRRNIRFHEQNLLSPCAHHGKFDVIFVRNVLIYFDAMKKKDVLNRLAKQLVPGGALVLGSAENTIGVTDSIVRRADCGGAIYARAGETSSRSHTPALSALAV